MLEEELDTLVEVPLVLRLEEALYLERLWVEEDMISSQNYQRSYLVKVSISFPSFKNKNKFLKRLPLLKHSTKFLSDQNEVGVVVTLRFMEAFTDKKLVDLLLRFLDSLASRLMDPVLERLVPPTDLPVLLPPSELRYVLVQDKEILD